MISSVVFVSVATREIIHLPKRPEGPNYFFRPAKQSRVLPVYRGVLMPRSGELKGVFQAQSRKVEERMRHTSPISRLTLLLIVAATTLLPPDATAATPTCRRVVTGSHTGLNGTTPAMAADGSTATSFQSSYNNWQYVQIDFSCVGDLSGLRRYMSKGGATGGSRAMQGEGMSYSLDGVTWIDVKRADTTGWESYVGYATTAWHSVPYGWSAWLRLKTPVKARYLRFRWDGDADALGEVEPFFYEPPPPDPQVSGLNALREASQTPLSVRFERGIPRFVAGKVPIPTTLPNDAVVHALDYLKRHRALYRFNDPLAELYLRRTSSGDTRHVFFGQHKNGIPVHGARFAVHLSKGEVLATNGTYLPVLPELPGPVLSVADAEKAAISDRVKTAKEVRTTGPSKLMYFNNGLLTGLSDLSTGTRLAYRVMLEGRYESSEKTGWTYFIDAHNGAILRRNESIASDPADKDFDIESGLGTDSDKEDWFDEDGAESDYGGAGSAEDPDFEGLNAFNFTHAIYDYFFGNFHRHSYDGGEDQVEVTIDLVFGPSKAGSAAYYSTFAEVIYVQGGMLSLFTLAHEFTHGVTEHSADFEYENESGALDESFADIFGAIISGDFSQLQGTPNHRSQQLPLAEDPEGDQSDSDFNDYGNVHSNSAIPNNAAQLIINGGTLNGINVPGIGVGKAQQLYYSVLTNWLSDCSNFRELRDDMVAEARLRTDFTDQDVCSVVNAFAAVGLGPTDVNCDGTEENWGPDGDNDGVNDPGDNCLGIPNPGQENLDGDGLGDACDADIDGDSVNNNVDNCPRAVNPGQENRDGDARGDVCDDDGDNDGIPDDRDNCPFRSNTDQTNTDGDTLGNACDTDDDNDTRPDTNDNCPLVINTDQANSDSDTLGNACDNCDFVANQNQLDSDRDGMGNSCDADDDNDGILDDGDGSGVIGDNDCTGGNTTNCDDNCQFTANADQQDINSNGIGIVCDPGEQRMVYGSSDLEFLRGLIRFQDIRLPVRIPVGPCLENCPDWFPEDFKMLVDLELPFDASVRVVDDRGYRVMSGGPGKVKQFDFRVDADYRFQPPTNVLGGDVGPFSGRKYFLEIMPNSDVIPGHGYEIGVRVRSGRPPFLD